MTSMNNSLSGNPKNNPYQNSDDDASNDSFRQSSKSADIEKSAIETAPDWNVTNKILTMTTLSMNQKEIKNFPGFDLVIGKVLDEVCDAHKKVPNDQCHRCYATWIQTKNQNQNLKTNLLQLQAFQTINDLDRALRETISRCNRKIFETTVRQCHNQLSASLSSKYRCEIDSWETRLKEHVPQQIKIIRAAFNAIKYALNETICQTTDLQESLALGDVNKPLQVLNSFGCQQSAQLTRALQNCGLIFQKLMEYHEAMQETGRIFYDSYRSFGIETGKNEFVDEHLKRINSLRSKYFMDNKQAYFSNWFKTSRTNSLFNTINHELNEHIEEEDNPISSQQKPKDSTDNYHHYHGHRSQRSSQCGK